jgi:hypothetical protein
MSGAEGDGMNASPTVRLAVARSYLRLLRKHGLRGARRTTGRGRRHAGASRALHG